MIITEFNSLPYIVYWINIIATFILEINYSWRSRFTLNERFIGRGCRCVDHFNIWCIAYFDLFFNNFGVLLLLLRLPFDLFESFGLQYLATFIFKLLAVLISILQPREVREEWGQILHIFRACLPTRTTVERKTLPLFLLFGGIAAHLIGWSGV